MPVELINISQGSLYITTNNPFDYPTIDPKYLTHTAGAFYIPENLNHSDNERELFQQTSLSSEQGRNLHDRSRRPSRFRVL
jgi:hypothetical protein